MDFYKIVKPKGISRATNTCVMQGIQNYENLIAPELCWPLMKLSTDCCIAGKSKQWICKIVLQKKKNGKRLFPLLFGVITAALAAWAIPIAAVAAAGVI